MHCGRHHLSSNAAPIYRQVRAKRRKTVAPSRFSFFSPISPLCFYCFNKLVKKKIHWLPLELIKLRGWALIALIEVVTVVEEESEVESEVEAGVEAEVVAVVEVVE